MHFLTTASKILGPPSIFIVKSSKANPSVTFDWKRLYDKNMYDGITIENTTNIYGVTYLSIFDYQGLSNDFDLITANKGNRAFQEYYFSQLEHSLQAVDSVPDPATGLLQITYRSHPRHWHNLLSRGGYIEIKVTISVKDNVEETLKAGQSFKSEISFHNLTIIRPDSKLGVGIVLFSSLSLSPSDDFSESNYLIPPLSGDGPITSRGSYVCLEEASTGSFFPETPINASKNQSVFRISQPLALFHASSVAHVEQNGSVTVLAGPRLPLQRGQRHRLTRCIGKALYGKRFNQDFQLVRRGNRKESPIGMRLQRFAFAASGQETAKYASW
ncbi:hypothetical protein Aperf_G00000127824 [Anoplocephala perfoliata]